MGLKTSKATLPFMNFYQFLLHISEFSSAKSFITLFITERGLMQFRQIDGSESDVFADSTYHNL